MIIKPRAQLTIESGGDEAGRTYILRAGQKFIIGRAFDSVIRLSDSLISRQHTSLELTSRGLEISDLGSRNGTYLDGKRLPPNSATLACSNDKLMVGSHIFTIEITGLDERAESSIKETRRLPKNVIPFDEFELLGEVGRGATGVVYGATQKNLLRNVAIKVPRTDVEDYKDCRLRFIREGQFCCKIDSPHVISVYDMRLQGDRVFIVMELVNGGSVQDRIATSVIPISEVAKIGEDVATGLMAIHREGIIHRDLKPANILLTPQGIAKLADFGIAKFLKSDDPVNEIPLTGSDEGLGTLGFVSPEGASCKSLGIRSDIYSLGATMYCMITNHIPFVHPGDGLLETIQRILFLDPPPIELYRQDCPKELSDLVMSMMAKDPKDRPPDAAVIATKLERIRHKYSDMVTKAIPATDEFSREDLATDCLP
jgi:serine/threonine protein kinase